MSKKHLQERSKGIGLQSVTRETKKFGNSGILSQSEKGALFAAQKSFFDNSKARLHCKSKTRPSGSDSWICGRYASLRIVGEKILIGAQSVLSHFVAYDSREVEKSVFGNSPTKLPVSRTKISHSSSQFQ